MPRASEIAHAGRHVHATVLFADLTGYSALADDRDEAFHALATISAQFELLAQRVVTRHRGIINEFRGDGVVAVFGLSGRDELDVCDAIDAALEMHRAIEEIQLPERWASSGHERLQLHSGVHSGLVHVEAKTDDKRIYRLTGVAPVLAVRFSDLAAANQIVVSTSSLEGLLDRYESRALPPYTYERTGRRIEIVDVLGRSEHARRFDARVRRGLSPFVGRSSELWKLHALREEAHAGAFRAVAIVGPAGIGKTRLCEEFFQRSYGASARVLRGNCDGSSGAAPLQPFAQVLREILDIDSRASGRLLDKAVLDGLVRLSPRLDVHAGDIVELLVEGSSDSLDSVEPEDIAERFVNAIARVLVAASNHTPLMLLLDDWQWADDGSQLVLARISQVAQSGPILVLLTSREKRSAAYVGFRPNRIDLVELDADETDDIARRLTANRPDFGIVARLHERTGGNPLFIEELCRTGDSAIFSDDPEPFTSRAVDSTPHWMSRLVGVKLDGVSAHARRFAECAAVIGRSSERWILEGVVGDALLDSVISELAEVDLLYCDREDGPLVFKHGLMRDIVYRTVDVDRRRALHGRVAHAIENGRLMHSVEGRIEALAYHFLQSGDIEGAIAYSKLAAERAEVRASVAGARKHYQTALDLLDRQSNSPAVQAQRSAVSKAWARVCIYSPSARQVERVRSQMHALTETHDMEGLARASYFAGYMSFTLGRHRDAQKDLQTALEIARELHMTNLEAEALGGLTHSLIARGEFDQAITFMDSALGMWENMAPSRDLPLGRAYTLSCKGLVECDRGHFEQGLRSMGDALRLLDGVEHQIVGSISSMRAVALLWAARWEEARTEARESRAFGQRIGAPYIYAISSAIEHYANWQLLGLDDDVEGLVRASAWIEEWGIGLFLALIHGWVVDALAMSGRVDDAVELHRRSREQRGTEGEYMGAEWGSRGIAVAMALHGGVAEAEERYLAEAEALAHRRSSEVQAAWNRRARALLRCAAGEDGCERDLLFAREQMSSLGISAEGLDDELLRQRMR